MWESGGGGLGTRPLRLSGGGSPRPPPQDEDEPSWPAVAAIMGTTRHPAESRIMRHGPGTTCPTVLSLLLLVVLICRLVFVLLMLLLLL